MPLRLLALSLILVASGCARRGSTSMPDLFQPPGNVQKQRFDAVKHDPYYDNDAGPEVVGGRPREFAKPLAEPVRSRWQSDSWLGR